MLHIVMVQFHDTAGRCRIGPHTTLSIACAMLTIMKVNASVQDSTGGPPASPPTPATRHGLGPNVVPRVKHNNQLHSVGATAAAEAVAGIRRSTTPEPLSLQLAVDPLKLQRPPTDDDINSMSASPTQLNRTDFQTGRQAPTSAESSQDGTRTLSSGGASILFEDATASTNSGVSQRGVTTEMAKAPALEGEALIGEPQTPPGVSENGACKGAICRLTHWNRLSDQPCCQALCV